MKSTLFNTMLGCLAALSLAGCGGHNNDDAASSSSSSSSVSGLINSGCTRVMLAGTMENMYPYTISLERTGDCSIDTMGDTYKGSWQDMTDSTNSFKIRFIGPFVAVEHTVYTGGITTVGTVELRLPEGALENYRSDNAVTGASFNVSPFTFISHSGDEDTANKDAITVMPQP